MSRDYAVEVLEKHSHGCYGKQKYHVWCLNDTSKKNACNFACEIVAGMTWRELFSELSFEDSILKMWVPRQVKNLDDVIGYDFAEKCFSFRAEVIK